MSLAVKTLKPDCKVIGVEPKNCRSFEAALKHGKPVTAEVRGTLADGLAVPMVSACGGAGAASSSSSSVGS